MTKREKIKGIEYVISVISNMEKEEEIFICHLLCQSFGLTFWSEEQCKKIESFLGEYGLEDFTGWFGEIRHTSVRSYRNSLRLMFCEFLLLSLQDKA